MWRLFAAGSILTLFGVGAAVVREIDDSSAEDRSSIYAAIAPDVDAAQDEMLSDGVVTNSEYLAAVQNAVQCMRAGGLDARVATGVHPGIEIFGPTSADDQERVQQCGSHHMDRAAVAWADQNQPTEQERRIALEELDRCYRAARGGAASETLTRATVRRILQSGDEAEAVALGHCVQANMDAYGFGF
jgi:hypothetical protein